MLFPYTYVPHQMDKMQTFIDFIFHEVWCKAPTSGPFGLQLFDATPELREVMEEFYYSDKKNADFFYGNVERIYGHFSKLNAKQIRRLKWWYYSNNNIEQLCSNGSGCHATRYSDIEKKFPSIAIDTHKFFTGLYDFDAAALKKKVGNIDDHYKVFASINRSGKCPFCGLSDLLGENHSKREAYDHYLPKAIYPFNSINFKNLVPTCHHCNSSYKGSKNPAYTPKDPTGGTVRRKVFYPFSATPHVIELQVTLQHADLEKMAPEEIGLTFGPAPVAEQIETWKDVYGIEERYRGKLLSGDGKAWLEEVLIERRWHDESAGAEGKTPEAHLRDVGRHTSRSPYANANFLKHSFLQACKATGLFDHAEKTGSVA
jgi:hypothetical protein